MLKPEWAREIEVLRGDGTCAMELRQETKEMPRGGTFKDVRERVKDIKAIEEQIRYTKELLRQQALLTSLKGRQIY